MEFLVTWARDSFFFMASISTDILSADLDYALADFTKTLTVVLPAASAGETFTATRRELQDAFTVDDYGRETKLDTRFYINIDGLSSYPSKGWIVSDGTRQFKVVTDYVAADNVGCVLDCEARHSRGA